VLVVSRCIKELASCKLNRGITGITKNMKTCYRTHGICSAESVLCKIDYCKILKALKDRILTISYIGAVGIGVPKK
jgi:hypothetical protein